MIPNSSAKSLSYGRKKILITGGAGYLATNVIALLLDTECRITRLDLVGTTFPPVKGRAQVLDLMGDIRDRAVWETALPGVDIVFHFAAQTSVYVAEQDPLGDLNINVMPMIHLLETCRTMELCPTILFSGTVTETGLTPSLPVNEGPHDHPITFYDLHKWISEKYLLHSVRRGNVRGAVLRLANVYGPGPKSSRPDRGVLNMMIRKAIRGEELTIYGEGDYVRDYIYVEDVARAFLEAAAHIERANGQYFVIGSGQGRTIKAAASIIADRVERKTGQRPPIVHVPPPVSLSPIETRDFIADSTLFKQAAGWDATVSLPEGIDRTVGYFLDQEASP